MLGHLRRQVAAKNAHEAGIVLDLFGVEELTAGDAALENHGLEHATPRVHGGAKPRRSGADDDEIECLGHGWKLVAGCCWLPAASY